MNLIFEAIKKGDNKAFKTFFEKHYSPLVGYANGYLYDKASSEDIVQESFIYLWENAKTLNIKRSLSGYMCKKRLK